MDTHFDTIALLVKAKALINTPEKWTQSSEARNKHGFPVAASDSEAVCFCALGAITAVTRSLHERRRTLIALRKALHKQQAEKSLNTTGIAIWNDMASRKHKEVLQLFDQAIIAEK